MINGITSKGNDESKEDVEKQGKVSDSSKSEGLKEFVFEIETKQSKSRIPNNSNVQNLDESGPIAQDLEIERREGYLKNNFFM